MGSQRFDAIISQPSHPWTAGASHLFTQEFFSLVRSRLHADGVFVQWMGLRFVNEALLRSLLATLLAVFPRIYGGRHVDHPAVRCVRVRQATIRADRSVTFHGDGEPVGHARPEGVRIEIWPDALSVAT